MTLKAIVVPFVALVVVVLSTLSAAAQNNLFTGDDTAWTAVAIKDLRVMMPAKPVQVADDETGEVSSIHALTQTGTFSVIIKQLDKQLDVRNTETMVDQAAVSALTAKTKLIDKHDVEYEGTRGTQVTYIEDGHRMFARIFYLNDRLIVMSASFKTTDYRPEYDVLVDRFFDSIRVKVPLLVA